MAENIKKTYTKDDFLSCKEIAKKFNLAREDVEQIMTNLHRKRMAKNHRVYVIKENHRNDASGLRAHPLLLDEIVEMVKQRGAAE